MSTPPAPRHRRLHIHFGMAKTGSTSIQRSLSKLDGQGGFCYLHVHALAACRDLATAFMPKPWLFRPLRRRGFTPEVLAARRTEILHSLERQMAGGERLFLSSETLSEFDETTLRAMADWLSARVDEIQLTGYVRPVAGYIESMFQQGIKNGNGEFMLARKYPGFRDRFQALESVFGEQRVNYRLFAPATFRHQCVVTDLADALGLGDVSAVVERVNDGLSLDALKLLYLYRRQGPGYGEGPEAVRSNNRLVRALSGLAGAKLRLSPQLLAPILAAQAEDIAWMERRLGASLREDARPDDAATVTSEADMLALSGTSLAWLASHAPAAWASQVAQGQPEAVIQALSNLRQSSPGPGPSAPARDAARRRRDLRAEPS